VDGRGVIEIKVGADGVEEEAAGVGGEGFVGEDSLNTADGAADGLFLGLLLAALLHR
jgi:hypothetical protein